MQFVNVVQFGTVMLAALAAIAACVAGGDARERSMRASSSTNALVDARTDPAKF